MTGLDLLRYARVHRAAAVLAGTAAVALVSAFFGGAPIALPSIGSGGISTGVPFRHELPLLSAVFLTAALDGPMSTHEEMGAVRLHRFRVVYCAIVTFLACAFSFGAEAAAMGQEAGLVFVRSLLIWFGLALVSVRMLGHQLGWVIPLGSAFFLIWYPQNAWDWTADPAADPVSWIVAATALFVGASLTATTKWRKKAILHRGKLPRR